MTKSVELKLRQSDCFKLLAACFYEPDKELFLQQRLCENLASVLAACRHEEAAAKAATMRTELEAKNEEELKVEYARLFIGPFELIAPPYGSIYLEKERRLMGDSTLAVQRIYREAGLELEVMEAPDHIALELEFMHYLALGEAAAETENQSGEAAEFAARQNEFLHRLLRPWVPAFCENIRQGTENGFYRALADCLESFMAEIRVVSETVSSLKQAENPDDCRAGL
jgi:putative dimethyl sulfoxide reductase chaperone